MDDVLDFIVGTLAIFWAASHAIPVVVFLLKTRFRILVPLGVILISAAVPLILNKETRSDCITYQQAHYNYVAEDYFLSEHIMVCHEYRDWVNDHWEYKIHSGKDKLESFLDTRKRLLHVGAILTPILFTILLCCLEEYSKQPE